MRGITVVGTGLDSGEALVAVAAYTAAREAGHEAALFATHFLGPDAESTAALAESFERQVAHALRTEASPAIAASHAGAALDPALLTSRGRDAAAGEDMLLIAAAPGGIMAPLTERYAVRDFARELGLPV